MKYLIARGARTVMFVLALLGLLACDGGGGGDSGFDKRTSIRDQRYCEVLALYLKPEGYTADVWNTWRLNECPQQDWAALDVDAIKLELGALGVQKNGPRFWTMDAIASSLSSYPELRYFGNIEFGLAAQVLFGTSLPSPIRFTENTVERDTEFSFYLGKSVYELIAPLGKRYVMQAYSQIDDPTLAIADLDILAPRLELPTGWQYQVRTLDEDLAIEDFQGLATVVQDNFSNTYQRAETLEVLPQGQVALEIVDTASGQAWLTYMDEQQAASLLVDFPWLVNPEESFADNSVYSRSPDKMEDGRFEQAELFGHIFTSSVTTLRDPQFDVSGLIATATVRKYHELTYAAGRAIPYLTSPSGEHYILVSLAPGAAPYQPDLPPGWTYAELTPTQDMRLYLEGDVQLIQAAIRTQTYQGPVALPQ
jgi:hypothetical protein